MNADVMIETARLRLVPMTRQQAERIVAGALRLTDDETAQLGTREPR